MVIFGFYRFCMKKLLALSAGALLLWQASTAQKLVADKIIGVVGDKIILKSDMDGALSDQQHNSPDGNLAPDAACKTLEMLISQKGKL